MKGSHTAGGNNCSLPNITGSQRVINSSTQQKTGKGL